MFPKVAQRHLCTLQPPLMVLVRKRPQSLCESRNMRLLAALDSRRINLVRGMKKPILRRRHWVYLEGGQNATDDTQTVAL